MILIIEFHKHAGWHGPTPDWGPPEPVTISASTEERLYFLYEQEIKKSCWTGTVKLYEPHPENPGYKKEVLYRDVFSNVIKKMNDDKVRQCPGHEWYFYSDIRLEAAEHIKNLDGKSHDMYCLRGCGAKAVATFSVTVTIEEESDAD